MGTTSSLRTVRTRASCASTATCRSASDEVLGLERAQLPAHVREHVAAGVGELHGLVDDADELARLGDHDALRALVVDRDRPVVRRQSLRQAGDEHDLERDRRRPAPGAARARVRGVEVVDVIASALREDLELEVERATAVLFDDGGRDVVLVPLEGVCLRDGRKDAGQHQQRQ